EVLDDRLRGSDLLAPAIRRLAQDLVRILAVGQADDTDLVELDAALGGGELADEALERLRAEGAGLLAGRVDVVRERDSLRIPGQQRDLARRERRPERGHDVVEPSLMSHERVGIALDDHGLAGLAHRALGLVDEVQRAALVEERRARRVEVLRAGVAATLALAAEDATAHARRRAVLVPDREQDPATELVDDADAARRGARGRGQPHLDELVGLDAALLDELAAHRVPAVRRPAELERLDRRVAEATPAQVVERGLAERGGGQHLVVERDRGL